MSARCANIVGRDDSGTILECLGHVTLDPDSPDLIPIIHRKIKILSIGKRSFVFSLTYQEQSVESGQKNYVALAREPYLRVLGNLFESVPLYCLSGEPT